MALLAKKSNESIYLKIFGGNLCEISRSSVSEFNPIEKRTEGGEVIGTSKFDENGFEVFSVLGDDGKVHSKVIKIYGGVIGHLVGIQYRTHEHDKKRYDSWQLRIVDGKETCFIEMGYELNVSRCFQNILPNINFDEQIELYVFKDKESKAIVLGIKQDGVNLKFRYTKNNPLGLPAARQLSNGKWDFTDQAEFLHQKTLQYGEILKIKISENGESESEYSQDTPFTNEILNSEVKIIEDAPKTRKSTKEGGIK